MGMKSGPAESRTRAAIVLLSEISFSQARFRGMSEALREFGRGHGWSLFIIRVTALRPVEVIGLDEVEQADRERIENLCARFEQFEPDFPIVEGGAE